MRIAQWLTAIMLLLFLTVARADDNPLLGTWKLKSFVREVLATAERLNQLGEHPNGYLATPAMAGCTPSPARKIESSRVNLRPQMRNEFILHRTFQGMQGRTR